MSRWGRKTYTTFYGTEAELNEWAQMGWEVVSAVVEKEPDGAILVTALLVREETG